MTTKPIIFDLLAKWLRGVADPVRLGIPTSCAAFSSVGDEVP